jgi:predicted Zn-ribbon and HTH transcriptional regulator
MSQPEQSATTAREVAEWQRATLSQRLADEGARDLARQLDECGREMILTCTRCGGHRQGHTQCHKRWCPVCQRAISARRVQRFRSAAEQMRWPLSIMLSHENEDEAANVFSTLMPAFKRFRRTKLWSKNVKGGVVSYEVTNRLGSWHDHLHVLCDCRWLALKTAKHELTSAWAECLGQETAVTWVDRASAGRLMEHIKYTVKGSDLLNIEQPVAPLLRALKGRRLVQPFGNLYGMSAQWKREDNEVSAPCKCPECQAEGSMLPDFVIEKPKRWR